MPLQGGGQLVVVLNFCKSLAGERALLSGQVVDEGIEDDAVWHLHFRPKQYGSKDRKGDANGQESTNHEPMRKNGAMKMKDSISGLGHAAGPRISPHQKSLHSYLPKRQRTNHDKLPLCPQLSH